MSSHCSKTTFGMQCCNDLDTTFTMNSHMKSDGRNMTTPIFDDVQQTDVINMTFKTVEEADMFYNMYARATGFSIRRSDLAEDDNGHVVYRKWVCSREGRRDDKWMNFDKRRRDSKALTRVGCRACFRIKYDRTVCVYVVSKFIPEHNHEMASQQCVPFLRSHRNVNAGDHALAMSMRRVGIKTSQIMKYFALQSGGYENIGFLSKDLYNHMDAHHREELIGGDAEAVLAYFMAKQDSDPLFYFKYDVDCENRLRTLFWSDSKCRMDYGLFGDALAFDSTYKTNTYHKPLVVLAGVNNHFCTTIFAYALLSDETVATYVWVLNTFLLAMGGKHPVSVITDSDNAMHSAICQVFPSAVHRLCSWHLERNAASHVKCRGFLTEFAKLLYQPCDTEQFETRWTTIIHANNLERNEWILNTYKRRHLWAEAYLKDKFFAGMRSTQRCEKMNVVLNMYLKEKLRLFEFVRAFDLALAWLRFSTAQADATTANTELMLVTQFASIERHMATLYTRTVFKMVRAELQKQAAILPADIISEGDHRIYYLSEWSNPTRRWRVSFAITTGHLECSCKLFDSKGLPCSHMFWVIIKEHMKELPKYCIKSRWLQNAHSALLHRVTKDVRGHWNNKWRVSDC